MKKIAVVAAIIYFKDEILCVQRPENKLTYISKKFEFPGGKIEQGETKEQALQRELIEELNLEAKIENKFLTVVHNYPDFELTMHSFICKVETKSITLREHISSIWLKRDQLDQLDWAAADIPIMTKLMSYA
jgi:8-oxo-dGTP diphosphatase